MTFKQIRLSQKLPATYDKDGGVLGLVAEKHLTEIIRNYRYARTALEHHPRCPSCSKYPSVAASKVEKNTDAGVTTD